MSFGKRLYDLRTEKKFSREGLAREVGTSGAVIGMYEREERTPSVEVARKIALVLEVSLDFLVGNTDQRLDASVINKIQEIQDLPSDDQKHLFYLIDNVLQNVRTRLAFNK